MYHFSRRSRLMLQGVHPDLILVASRALLYSDVDFAVTEGVRSLERQRALLDKGFSRTLKSKHLVQPDGFAYAIDVMASGDLNKDGTTDAQDRSIVWNREFYGTIAAAFYKAAKELEIVVRWGGNFKTFYDGPHFELLGE